MPKPASAVTFSFKPPVASTPKVALQQSSSAVVLGGRLGATTERNTANHQPTYSKAGTTAANKPSSSSSVTPIVLSDLYNEEKKLVEKALLLVRDFADVKRNNTTRASLKQAIKSELNIAHKHANEQEIRRSFQMFDRLIAKDAGDDAVKKNWLALRIVDECLNNVISNAADTLSMVSAVLAGLCRAHPYFRSLLLGKLAMDSIFLSFDATKCSTELASAEQKQKFIEREKLLIRLLLAVHCTPLAPGGDGKPLKEGPAFLWSLTAHALNRPSPRASVAISTVLSEIIETTGWLLHSVYSRQFVKMVRLAAKDLLPFLDRTGDSSPSVGRLELILERTGRKYSHHPIPEMFQ